MLDHETIPILHKSNNLTLRLHVNNSHTYHGIPYLSEAGMDMVAQMNAVEYREEYLYINNTYKNITIQNRIGFAVTIPYVSSCSSRDFIIRKIINIRGTSLESTITAMSSLAEIDSAELQEIKRCLSNVDKHNYNGVSIMLDYVVTSEDIKSRGNTLYHYQTDLVVSFEEIVKVDSHPYSPNFINVGAFGHCHDYKDQDEFNIKLRYVNHDRNAVPVYVNLLGKVFTLYPQRDAPARRLQMRDKTGKNIVKEYSDYIQLFFSTRNDPATIYEEGVSHIRLSLEEAKESLGLYSNYAEALCAGNPELSRKEELIRLTHQLEILKQNFSIEDTERKAELSREAHRLELQKRELDAIALEQKRNQTILESRLLELENEKKDLDLKRKEQDDRIARENKVFEEKIKQMREENESRLKNESNYWRDFYENRNHIRKDTSDWLKMIPAVLTTAAAAYIAYEKIKSSGKN